MHDILICKRCGSADELVKTVPDTVAMGLRQSYEKVADAFKHKDESVHPGRDYLAAYVECTHYLERLQMAAEKPAAHHDEHAHKQNIAPKPEHDH